MINIMNPELFFIHGEMVTEVEHPYYLGKVDTASVFVGVDGEPSKLRPILRITSPDENYNEYKQIISSKTMESKSGKGSNISLLVKATKKQITSPSDDVYLIGIPFHGIIKPIAPVEGIRILKGMISISSQYSILWKNQKYKNVVYLVVTIDPEVRDKMDPSAWLNLNIEAYSLKTTGKKKTKQTTILEQFDIKFGKDPDAFNLTAGCEEVEPVDMKQYQNKPVWEIYHLPEVEMRPKREGQSGTPAKKPVTNTKQAYTQRPATAKVYGNGAPSRNTSTEGKKPYRKPEILAGSSGSRKPVCSSTETVYRDKGYADPDLDDMINKAFADGKHGGKSAKRSKANGGKKRR